MSDKFEGEGVVVDHPMRERGRMRDGGGPEDPMLGARVTRLEEDVREVKSILTRLEPMIVELVHTTARKSDIERLDGRITETREELRNLRGQFLGLQGEIKGLLPTRMFVFWMIGLFVALAGLFLRAAN